MERPDPIMAHAHERAAERHRQAASRFRELDMTEAEEAAKTIARQEDAQAAQADSPDSPDSA